MKRRSRIAIGGSKCLLLASAAVFTILLAACDRTPTSTTDPGTTPEPIAGVDPSFQAEWDALIKAARNEGPAVFLFGGSAGLQHAPLVDHFQKLFGVRVTLEAGRGADQVQRLLAEQKAGVYSVDLVMMSETSALRLIAIDGFEPIRNYLIHPHVLDESNWYQNKLWFTDPQEIYSINTSAAAEPLHLDFRYNTKLVRPEDIENIRSIFDLVDPKWKGKITAIPPTSTRVSYFNIAAHPGFNGEKFLRQMFDPALKVFWSEDSRIIVDGIAQGRFAFGIQLGSLDQELDALAAKGAPVARLDPAKELAEGMMLSGSGSGDQLQIAKNPPNPNITKLFVNWYLSREGQTARHQMSVSEPSPTLRNDVECPGSGGVNPAHCRKPGRTDYIYLGADPKYSAKRQVLFNQTVGLFKKISGR